MLMSGLARFAIRAPRRIIGGALLFLVIAGIYAAPATWKLPAGGFDVPNAESARAAQILDEKFGAGGASIVFAVRAESGADGAAAKARAAEVTAALQASPYARQMVSYWTTPAPLNTSLATADRRTGLIAARIVGNDKEFTGRAWEVAEQVVGTRDGVTVTAGGETMIYRDIFDQARKDLLLLEAVAIPFTFIALVWIFGSAVASLLPIIVSFCAIAGTSAALWAIYNITGSVSFFALNLGSAFCLAMAVDYTLFIVNRYREERARGVPPERALTITMHTAGRTVVYSGATMGLIMATLLVFPQYLFRSLGYAGLFAVLTALVGALVVAPALIVVLGDRIDAFDIRKPIRRRFGRTEATNRAPEQQFWYKVAVFSMRRAWVTVLLIGALLLALGWPLLGMKMGFPDDRQLAGSQSRTTGDLLRTEFPQNNLGSVLIVMPSGVASPRDVTDYARELSKVDGVTAVSSPNGIYAAGRSISAATFDSALIGDAAYVSVSSSKDPLSTAGEQQLAALKEVPAPAPTLFGGFAQRNADNVAGITDRVPLVITLITLITFALIFLMTGSLVLPIKAVLLNVFSLSAALGAMVWVFQDGNLGGLGTTATGLTIATIPPFVACVAYGLSMDYEVFVLSRIREEWAKSGRTAADNERAVALGMARTGRIVTAAAVIMIIVFLALSIGNVGFMRGLGIGLAVGVVIDAFVIRTLLVPALMKLFATANWWAPKPIARWHERRGFAESDDAPEEPPRGTQPDRAELVH